MTDVVVVDSPITHGSVSQLQRTTAMVGFTKRKNLKVGHENRKELIFVSDQSTPEMPSAD